MDLPPHLCIVSTDRDPADSPDLRLAELLATTGWDVHVLACDSSLRPTLSRLALTYLDDLPESPEGGVPEWRCGSDRRSLHVLAAIEKLHSEKPFDVIQYPEEGAVGYRLAQARRAGISLDGAFLLARLRGPTAWRRTSEARWLTKPDDLCDDFAEQTSFELADGHVSQSQYLLDEARRLGWSLPLATGVVPDCPAATLAAAPPSGEVREVVFAGPLDKLHGLRIFVRAAQTLPANVSITLVGADSVIEGLAASVWAAGKLKGRRVTYHPAKDWSAIIDYLRGPSRLAVVPYLAAPDVEFVRALAQNRVPFLVSDFGPASELVGDSETCEHLVFPGSVAALSRALAGYLATATDRRHGWVERLAEKHCSRAANAIIEAFYGKLQVEVRARRLASLVPAAPRVFPKVTVGVTHYNLGRFLPATLASVAAQTYPNLEVVVADDGSNDPESLAVVDEMERKYPTFRFLRGPNVGVCENRNRCLDSATGELFFPLDADNIAAPNMIECLVAAFQRQPADVGAVSCFWLGFTSDEDLKAERFCGCYRPTGGPRTVVGLWNPYGETSGLFRTKQLRELGGYDDLHPEYVSEDWHLYIKLVARGLKVAVIPKALYFYRFRVDSRYRTGDHGVNHLRVLPDVAALAFTQPELLEVWSLLASLSHTAERSASALQEAEEHRKALAEQRDALADRLGARRYWLVDAVCSIPRRVASVRGLAGYVLRKSRRAWGSLKQRMLVSGHRE